MTASRSTDGTVRAATEGSTRFLEGGGEMGALMRAHDWSRTSLGDPVAWRQPLRTRSGCCSTPATRCTFSGARAPPAYTTTPIAARSVRSGIRARSAGRPGREVWAEIWDIIGPQIRQVMQGGPATWHVDQLVPITWHGRREDVYRTYSYGPIDDQSAPTGVGGVVVVCTETTDSVLSRQSQAFHIALEQALRGIDDPHDAMAAAAEALGRHLGVGRCGYGDVDRGGEYFQVVETGPTAGCRASPADCGWTISARS